MTLWAEKKRNFIRFSLDIAEGFGYCVVGKSGNGFPTTQILFGLDFVRANLCSERKE